MKKIVPWLNDSKYIAPLSPACKMCAEGSKMVLLITGICSANCYYCPLSLKKLGKDRIFADEWELENEDDKEKLILEAKNIKAKGAGITGGDPLIVWMRTKKYISFLKDNFGSKFHIHLYTSGIKNAEYIKDLVSVGLDEIRFHPIPNYWNKMDKNPITHSIKRSINIGLDVAIEIPAIPKSDEDIFFLIKWADDIGIDWINLNELEFSETNFDKLDKKNYTVKNDISAAVKGSQETAINVIDMVSKSDFKIGVHYCSSSFKDGVQLRNRIKRRAKNIAKIYEIITDEGTIFKGIILSKKKPLKALVFKLEKEHNVEKNLFYFDKNKNRIEIAPWVLENISKKLKNQGYECYLIEEYPTADSLEVERIPLPI